MKKYLIKIVLFLPFLLAVYGALLLTFGLNTNLKGHPNLFNLHQNSGHFNRRLSEADTTKNVDYLFLGSSHAYRGFDGRNFKGRSMNLGSSNQTFIQGDVLLKQYFDDYQPKIVIYEIYPYMFQMRGIKSAIDIAANTKRRDSHVLKMLLEFNDIRLYNEFYFSMLRSLFIGDKDEAVVKGEDEYIKGGYSQKNTDIYERKPINSGNWTPKESQITSFENSVEYINEKGAELYLVFAPITKEEYATYVDIAKIDSFFHSYGNYINFNEIDLGLKDSVHFYDSNHMKVNGVKIFNEALKDTIPGLF